MRTNHLLIVLLLFSIKSISQKIDGTVMSNKFVLSNVEVINYDTKEFALTDADGNFSISAKKGDLLVFVSKNHELKQLPFNPTLLVNGKLIVNLTLIAEELDEILITNTTAVTLKTNTKIEQIKRDEIKADREERKLKPLNVDDLSINKGLNVIRVVGFIADKLKKEKEPLKRTVPEIAFYTLAKNSYDQNFYIKTLKLQPDQIELFIQFCDADPKSKTIAANQNTLSLMDFLFEKNTAFKNLNRVN